MDRSEQQRAEIIEELLRFDNTPLQRTSQQDWHLPSDWKWDPRGPKGQVHQSPKDFRGVEYPDNTPQKNTILGKGNSGVVHRVLCNGRILARKKALIDVKKARRVVANTTEIQALKRIDHHHISQLVGLYVLDNDLYSLSHPVAETSLMDYLKLNRTNDPTWVNTLISGMGCLSNALEYMHSVGVKHRDIHNENVLVLGTCLIFVDFGGVRLSNRKISSIPYEYDNEFESRSWDVMRLGQLFGLMLSGVDGGRVIEGPNGFDNPQQTELDIHNLRTYSASPKQIGRQDFRCLFRAMTVKNEKARPSAALVAQYLRRGHYRWAINQRTYSEDNDDGNIYCNTCGECCK